MAIYNKHTWTTGELITSELMNNIETQLELDSAGTSSTSEDYDSSTSYKVGDYCLYEGTLYKCKTATTGAWDNTKWEQVTLTDNIQKLESILAGLISQPNTLQPILFDSMYFSKLGGSGTTITYDNPCYANDHFTEYNAATAGTVPTAKTRFAFKINENQQIQKLAQVNGTINDIWIIMRLNKDMGKFPIYLSTDNGVSPSITSTCKASIDFTIGTHIYNPTFTYQNDNSSEEKYKYLLFENLLDDSNDLDMCVYVVRGAEFYKWIVENFATIASQDILKLFVEKSTGNSEIIFTENAYIDLSSTTADPSNPTSYGLFRYALVDCAAGDEFTIKATGSASARAWGFLDSSNNIISKGLSSESYDGLLVAPTNAVKLVINDSSNSHSYKGNLLVNVATATDDAIKMFAKYEKIILPENTYRWYYYYNPSTDKLDLNTPVQAVNPYRSGIIPVASNETIIIKAATGGGNNARLWAFTDTNTGASVTPISIAAASITANNLVLRVPDNANYLILNSIGDYEIYKGIDFINEIRSVDNATNAINAGCAQTIDDITTYINPAISSAGCTISKLNNTITCHMPTLESNSLGQTYCSIALPIKSLLGHGYKVLVDIYNNNFVAGVQNWYFNEVHISRSPQTWGTNDVVNISTDYSGGSSSNLISKVIDLDSYELDPDDYTNLYLLYSAFKNNTAVPNATDLKITMWLIPAFSNVIATSLIGFDKDEYGSVIIPVFSKTYSSLYQQNEVVYKVLANHTYVAIRDDSGGTEMYVNIKYTGSSSWDIQASFSSNMFVTFSPTQDGQAYFGSGSTSTTAYEGKFALFDTTNYTEEIINRIKKRTFDAINTSFDGALGNIENCLEDSLKPDVDIIFWGDSLTAGAGGGGVKYPTVCAQELGLSYLNCGVGGETANTVAARQGGNSIIIPAGAINGTYSYENVFQDIFGGKATPLRQGNGSNSGNKLIINGDVCNLSISQTSSTSTDATYTISGYTKGTSSVPLPAKFVGSNFTSRITSIWVGQNGSTVSGLSGYNARMAIIDSMIAHLNHNNYIVLGISTGTNSTMNTDDAAMKARYGNKFFPTRKMLVENGLTIAGITPTTQDTTDIAAGTVPTSLRSDNVHLNAAGYNALGKMVAQFIRDLGYLDANIIETHSVTDTAAKLVSFVENTMIASKAYVVGDYLNCTNVLYRVIAPITIGDVLTVGTNIRIVSNGIGEDIKNTILAQSAQPTADTNKIWIPTDTQEGTQVPTYEEFEVVKNALTVTTEKLVNEEYQNGLQKIRGKLPERFVPYVYPEGFDGTYKPVTIFTDGKNYVTDFNKERFKNIGGNIMYCAPLLNGTSSSKSGTYDDPKNLFGALRDVTDGGTVYVKPGVYSATDLSNVVNGTYKANICKSINIIGLGDVVFCYGGVYYPESTQKGYSDTYGLYTITRAGTAKVIDKGLFEWKRVGTITECQAQKGTWCIEDSTVYLNANDEPEVYVLQGVQEGMSINPTTGIRMYFENIMMIGGYYSAYVTSPSQSGEIETVWNNCKFLFGCSASSSTVYNALRFCGDKCLCVDCIADHALSDGFGYNEKSGIEFVEINCIGANNGETALNPVANCNGSTAHQAGKGVRVNGCYYGNFGANVADVHNNTQTINLGCIADDSIAGSSSGYNQGISAQQSGATMWVENCSAHGNEQDLYCASGATMYVTNSEYETRGFNGTVTEIGGNYIKTGEDLDNYKNSGIYKCASEATAQSLSHCPTTVRFTMEVFNLNTYCMQVIYTENEIFTRRSGYNNGYVWRNWYKYAGTVVS